MILREGPALGVHVITWCDTVNNLNRYFTHQQLREFEMRVLFQMSPTDSGHLLDSPAASKLGRNRALFASEEQNRLEKFRPYGLPDERWLEEIGKQLGERSARLNLETRDKSRRNIVPDSPWRYRSPRSRRPIEKLSPRASVLSYLFPPPCPSGSPIMLPGGADADVLPELLRTRDAGRLLGLGFLDPNHPPMPDESPPAWDVLIDHPAEVPVDVLLRLVRPGCFGVFISETPKDRGSHVQAESDHPAEAAVTAPMV